MISHTVYCKVRHSDNDNVNVKIVLQCWNVTVFCDRDDVIFIECCGIETLLNCKFTTTLFTFFFLTVFLYIFSIVTVIIYLINT